MKLDEGLNFQKQSLDLTPLIDIIFLLVLFFAVSTSFISREDLQALKSNVVELTGDRTSLTDELTRTANELETLRTQLALAERKTVDLETSVDRLTAEKEQALGRSDALDARLTALERERERQQERMQALQQQLDQTSSSLALAEQRTQTLEASVAERSEQRQQAEKALDQANEQRRRLDVALSEARTRIERLEVELAEFRELATLDRKQIERMLAAQQTLQANLDDVVDDDELDIKHEDQVVILQLSDRLLFDSGSAAIKDEGVEVLTKVGNTIKSKLRGMRIQVAGHTDSVPVTPGQGAWSNNWSLSAARAVNVLQLLEEQVGIDPQLLSAVGYGEHRPIADNESAEGRAKNRRIELVLAPQ
jgi:chemotaxis protein MotB